jgi:hypothetical protein
MLKKFLAVSAVALSFFIIGCGVTDPEEATAPTITGPAKVDTLKANSPVTAAIVITAKDTISAYTGKVTTAAGGAVAVTSISVVPQVTENAVKSKKITYTLTSLTAAAGAYVLEISATSKGLTSTVKFDLVVAGAAGTPVTPSSVITLGAHDNATLGSSLDLDNGTVMLAAAARAAGTAADIIYTYSSKTPAGPVLMSPAYAKASSGITAFETWANPFDTKFHKVTGVTYESITTDVALKALYNEASATATAGRLNIAAGDLVVVLTSEGKYALVNIITVSADATGTASIKYAK